MAKARVRGSEFTPVLGAIVSPGHGGSRDGAGRKAEAEKARETVGSVLDRYNEARASREEANARIADMQARKAAGELLERSEVLAHWQSLVAAFRARMLAIPTKVAPRVATPDKVVACADLIMAEIYEALAEISSDGLPRD
jgi:hypothetical protein